MNQTIKHYIYSGAVTFVGAFLTAFASLLSVTTYDQVFTGNGIHWAVFTALIGTAIRTAVKAISDPTVGKVTGSVKQ